MDGSDEDPSIVPRFLAAGAPTPRPVDDATDDADDDHVRAVRPFIVTQGRTGTNTSFTPETQLVCVGDPSHFSFEKHDLLTMLATPCSIAEVSVYMQLPLQAVGVLAQDLAEAGALEFRFAGSVDDPAMIRRLIDVVRAI